MSSISNYINISSQAKLAVGCVAGATIAYAMKCKDPVTAVAAVAIGQGITWLPSLVGRCFQRVPAQQAEAIAQQAEPALIAPAVSEVQQMLKQNFSNQALSVQNPSDAKGLMDTIQMNMKISPYKNLTDYLNKESQSHLIQFMKPTKSSNLQKTLRSQFSAKRVSTKSFGGKI